MALPDCLMLLTQYLFKDLRKKVCEAYSFFQKQPNDHGNNCKKHLCSSLWKWLFLQRERIQSPYTYRLNVRVLVQLERITFRAVLMFIRTALFVSSESDTFLMNFITLVIGGQEWKNVLLDDILYTSWYSPAYRDQMSNYILQLSFQPLLYN